MYYIKLFLRNLDWGKLFFYIYLIIMTTLLLPIIISLIVSFANISILNDENELSPIDSVLDIIEVEGLKYEYVNTNDYYYVSSESIELYNTTIKGEKCGYIRYEDNLILYKDNEWYQYVLKND